MAVESSTVSEVRFQGVFCPKFMTAVEGDSCSVISLIIVMSWWFMFVVNRWWLSIDCRVTSS